MDCIKSEAYGSFRAETLEQAVQAIKPLTDDPEQYDAMADEIRALSATKDKLTEP